MGASTDAKGMERRQHIAARILGAVMAVLVAVACVLLATGYGEGSIATNGVPDTSSSVSTNKPFYVLLIGSDSRKGTALYTGNAEDHAQVEQHADTITLVRVDPKKYTITLITVPPETVLDGESAPISDTLLNNDPKETVAAVEKLTGVNIPYYLMVDFSGFEDIIDELDDIVVNVDVTVTSQDPIDAKNVVVKAGSNKELLPSGALAYARAWEEYSSDNSAHRQQNIRKIEVSMIKKVLGMDTNAAIGSAEALSGNTITNMNSTLVRKLVRKFQRHGSKRTTIYECTGPDKVTDKAKGTMAEDKTAWKHLMYVVDLGEDPHRSYKEVKAEQDAKAAEEAAAQQQQQMQEQGGQYSYQNDTWYGQQQNGGTAQQDQQQNQQQAGQAAGGQ